MIAVAATQPAFVGRDDDIERVRRAVNGHARLVVVEGNQHTGYGVNECSTSAVDNYLIDPVGHLPPEGLVCKA